MATAVVDAGGAGLKAVQRCSQAAAVAGLKATAPGRTAGDGDRIDHGADPRTGPALDGVGRPPRGQLRMAERGGPRLSCRWWLKVRRWMI